MRLKLLTKRKTVSFQCPSRAGYPAQALDWRADDLRRLSPRLFCGCLNPRTDVCSTLIIDPIVSWIERRQQYLLIVLPIIEWVLALDIGPAICVFEIVNVDAEH